MSNHALRGEAAPLTVPALGVPHGFFTRRGGVSTGPFASLNCSRDSPDRAEAVAENRARAAHTIGAEPARLFGVRQVHGNLAVKVAGPWEPGEEPAADAMVTDRPGLALGVITADCAPVLLADTTCGVIGAAHAGWRGAVAGILEATVNAMVALGGVRERIQAAIGPAIRQASYEVGPDLREAVLGREAADARFFILGRSPGRWQFDLPGYCRSRLIAAGVRNLEAIALDTARESGQFFSHRRRTLSGGGPIGHQISIIMLPTG
ncbi:MAG: peptidoglycan editing factor PgeF [Acetobacteraceae bacterium]